MTTSSIRVLLRELPPLGPGHQPTWSALWEVPEDRGEYVHHAEGPTRDGLLAALRREPSLVGREWMPGGVGDWPDGLGLEEPYPVPRPSGWVLDSSLRPESRTVRLPGRKGTR